MHVHHDVVHKAIHHARNYQHRLSTRRVSGRRRVSNSRGNKSGGIPTWLTSLLSGVGGTLAGGLAGFFGHDAVQSVLGDHPGIAPATAVGSALAGSGTLPPALDVNSAIPILTDIGQNQLFNSLYSQYNQTGVGLGIPAGTAAQTVTSQSPMDIYQLYTQP